jgi:hypothetical protein
MFFETAPPPDTARIAAGPPTSAGDVYEAAIESAHNVDNLNARRVTSEEAYDRRIDAVKAATGIELANPMRGPALRVENGVRVPAFDAAADEFMRELHTLQRQYPDRADVIQAGRSPLEDAKARANAAEQTLTGALDRYDGPWGTGTLAAFAGGFVGGLADPANLATMFFGPMGRAGPGIKGLLWMGLKQGVANAGVETAFQPIIADWRREAGLEYGASTFAMNVGTAFALGFGADAGIRGTARSARALQGRVPVLDDAGGVMGYETPDAALDRAARRSRNETMRTAVAGDEIALRELARETGLDQAPEVRAIFDALDDARATDTRAAGVDADDDAARNLQTLRHLIDPDEPLPVAARPVPEAKGETFTLFRGAPDFEDEALRGAGYFAPDEAAAREYAGPGGQVSREAVTFESLLTAESALAAKERLGLKRGASMGDLVDAARAQGYDGLRLTGRTGDEFIAIPSERQIARQALREAADPLEAARILRTTPGALDSSVPLVSSAMRQGRALSALSERAFEQVESGQAPPELGALVADLVPDASRHDEVLWSVNQAGPRTAAEARRMIGAMVRQRVEPLTGGLDDVAGAAGERQIADLEAMLDPNQENPRRVFAAEQEALAEAPDVALQRALDEADTLDEMANLIGGCEL